MASISASTMHGMKKTKPKNSGVGRAGGKKSVTGKSSKSNSSSSGVARRSSVAPKLKAFRLAVPSAVETLRALDEPARRSRVQELVRLCLGERVGDVSTPHTASTTQDRARAAADVAVATQELGVLTVLKRYGVLAELEQVLIPQGIGRVFANADGTTNNGGMKKIASALSLMSMVSEDNGGGGGSTVGSFTGGGSSIGGRGGNKQMPPAAREGALLLLRALGEIIGRAVEPYVVPLLAPVLEECGSSSSNVRTAAEDTAVAIIQLATPHATPKLLCPVLFAATQSSEWRIKVNALDRLSQLADTAPQHISPMLPAIIPAVTAVVWDTKPQVVNAAKHCLHRSCHTNLNPDIRPAIPAVVNAIVKPVTETTKAIDELMATTFVATVDASTLAILCPVLSRGLREKFTAVHKRSCCLVIQNMSRLVETPQAVAPFGPLLVPDLKKVAENVQFEEIRDAALAALQTLTRALGHASIEEAVQDIMADESRRIQEEQTRIEEEREEERKREEDMKRREEEERRLWKEAMEAELLLDQIAEKESEEKKIEVARKKEKAKTQVKTSQGKCKGCNLKKCRPPCLFYEG